MNKRTRMKGRVAAKRQRRTRVAAKRPHRTRVAAKRPRKTRVAAKRPRRLNEFFKVMLKAKKNGDESFKYNGHTYRGTKHDRLGMIYKKV